MLPSSKQTGAEALWRTIIRNSFAQEYPAPSNAGNEFFSWMASIKAGRKDWEEKDLLSIFKPSKSSPAQRFGSSWFQLLENEPANSRIDKERFQHLMSESKCWIPIDARDAQIREEIDFVIGVWRRRFRDNNGFLGVGPRSSKAGDQIWILAGKGCPFILRSLETENFNFLEKLMSAASCMEKVWSWDWNGELSRQDEVQQLLSYIALVAPRTDDSTLLSSSIT
jgi:hypothetical protein